MRVGEATIASRFSFIESTGQIQSVKVSTLTYRDKNLNVRWQRGRAPRVYSDRLFKHFEPWLIAQPLQGTCSTQRNEPWIDICCVQVCH